MDLPLYKSLLNESHPIRESKSVNKNRKRRKVDYTTKIKEITNIYNIHKYTKDQNSTEDNRRILKKYLYNLRTKSLINKLNPKNILHANQDKVKNRNTDQNIERNEENIYKRTIHLLVFSSKHLLQAVKPMSASSNYLSALRPQNLSSRLFSRESRTTSGYVFNNFHWLLPRALQRRLLLKNGDYNISSMNIERRSRQYLADFFTTLIDLQWRVDLLIFAATFTLSWLFFGFLWWFISFVHDDFVNKDNPGWKPCLKEVHDFRSALLLSIETQQTIGYGFRNVTTHCSVAVITIMLQSCFGLVIQALMTGLIFAKLSRPKKRAQTLMFSQKALICERDDQLCLLFRIADMRRSQIVEAHVRAFMVSKKVTKEGEVLSFHQQNLRLETSDEEGRLFLAWPNTVEHKITKESPLWDISATDLIHRHFEVVVIMEGIVESTGMTTQARTSYLPSEILWGHRFDQVVSFRPERGQYVVDFAKLNCTTPFSISELSAKQRSKRHSDESERVNRSRLESVTEDEEDSEGSHNSFKHLHSHQSIKSDDSEVDENKKSNKDQQSTNFSSDSQRLDIKITIPRLKMSKQSRKHCSDSDSDFTQVVASHVASAAFNVIGATSIKAKSSSNL